jgi:predicted  nucleic acid-binding Zn-ribbon protein
MDSEIKEEFAAVRADLRSVSDRVRAIDARVRDVDARVRDVDTRLSEVDTRLTAEIREEGVATRRHFDVGAESLRDDIRIIAEGFVALDAKVERIRDSR